ncbi:MAG: hypothetical protein GX163_11235 [Bacteroidetes bacterium]|nr:hypothetical protein [Bacteroidota bacterium]
MKNTVLILFFLISNILSAQTEKLNRFYDFGIELDFYHLLFDDDYKIILPNSFDYDNLKKNTLYKVKFSYDENKNRIPQDTLMVNLRKSEMDKIFTLTKNQFDIKYDENKSEHKIPPAPYPYDGLIVNLTFELGFWGDRYIKKIGVPFTNKKFNELNNYIELLIKKYKTE